LRTDGVPAFAETLSVASQWLETHWSQVYPLVDEDAILRRNALNCFADPMAVIDGLRRTRLVNSRQHGAFSLRDMEIATHQLTPGETDQQVDEAQVNAAFASMPMTELSQLHESLVGAVASLKRIDAKMRDAAGTEATPGFDPLTAQLVKMTQVLRAQIALHPDSAAATISGAEEAAGESPSGATGPVKSRQDAIRALDAVADFFKRTEPSSPIPLFLARAKRLVSKDFLEVLADIAPDAVAQARAAGGLKDE
jgi:type VI secretion system protein ImpA